MDQIYLFDCLVVWVNYQRGFQVQLTMNFSYRLSSSHVLEAGGTGMRAQKADLHK